VSCRALLCLPSNLLRNLRLQTIPRLIACLPQGGVNLPARLEILIGLWAGVLDLDSCRVLPTRVCA